MATYGPLPFATAANVNDLSGVSNAWSNPNNALVDDGVSSTVSLVGSGNTLSQYLRLTNPNPVILAGETIVGILLEIKAAGTVSGPSHDVWNKVRFFDGSVDIGNDKSTGATLPSSLAYVSFGSSADNWGGITRAQANSSSFSITVQISETDTLNTTGSVDNIRITFTTAAASSRKYQGSGGPMVMQG